MISEQRRTPRSPEDPIVTPIRTKLTRRHALMGASAVALAAALPASAAAPVEQAAIEIAGVRDPQLGAQLSVAQQLGYFKDEGLDATVHWNQSAADVLTLMGGGSQHIGAGGTFTQVVLSGQHLPVRTIAALADIAATQGFALSPGVKLASPRDLEGKKLAFTQGNSQVLILAKLAKIYGFDMSRVTLVNMNPSEGVVAASKGDVQGLLGWQPNLYRLVAMGGTMYATGTTSYVDGTAHELPFDDRFQFNHSVLLASDDWIANKPNTLRAVLRALLRADALIAKDRPAALAAMQSVLKIDPDALKVMTDANKYGISVTPSLARSIDFVSDWAMSIKRIPSAVAPKEALAPALLASVDPALVSWAPGA
jgi:NitT/TauT family transport system substrate-binding protein